MSEVEDSLAEITDVEQKRQKRLKRNGDVSENSGTTLNAPASASQGCQKEKTEGGRKKQLKR